MRVEAVGSTAPELAEGGEEGVEDEESSECAARVEGSACSALPNSGRNLCENPWERRRVDLEKATESWVASKMRKSTSTAHDAAARSTCAGETEKTGHSVERMEGAMLCSTAANKGCEGGTDKPPKCTPQYANN